MPEGSNCGLPKLGALSKGSLSLDKVVLVIAILLALVGFYFHVRHLLKDRSVNTPEDVYNEEESDMFYKVAVFAAVIWVGICVGKIYKHGYSHHEGQMTY